MDLYSGDVKHAVINCTHAGAGDLTALAAVAGKKLKILAGLLTISAAASITFKSGATAITGAMAFTGNGQINMSPHEMGHLETAPGEAFVCNANGVTNVRGWVRYVEV